MLIPVLESNLDSLVNLLKERGKVPSNHIRRIEGSECTREGYQGRP